MHRFPASTLAVAVLTAAGLVLAAGCSADTPAPDPGASAAGDITVESSPQVSVTADTPNLADIEFTQMMIVHHQGALEMAQLAVERAQAADVKELAERIEQAQQPEIETMKSWLRAWGAEPLDAEGSMPGMDHGSMTDTGEGGMASDPQMLQLQDAQGAEFDTLFLQLMIVHHQGAVAMAQTEVDGGESTEAVTLAQKVIVDQTAEIDLMQGMLDAK